MALDPTVVLMLLASAQGPGSAGPADAPLFASHDPVTLTLEAPLARVMRERHQDPKVFPGRVIVTRADGRRDTLGVKVSTRGNTRLRKDVCQFTPLRLDFHRDSVGGTVFAGQNKLKLVTHCQNNRKDYEQNVLLEYLIYRTYNLLTDLSFRVRLAHVTYVDEDAKRDTLARYAFFIEDDDAMAQRNGWKRVLLRQVPPVMMEPHQLALADVFQYYIGNTDYSAFLPEHGDDHCCHNSTPIGRDAGPVFPVPYDFDMSGLMHTRYADRLFRDNLRRLGLWSVRDRLYRGACASAPELPAIFDLFNQQHNAILALYADQEGLAPKARDQAVKYIRDFYQVINDPKAVERQFADKCRHL